MKESIKKVSTWEEKSPNLLHKKADYILKILLLTTTPIKLEELLKFMNYKNRKTFTDNYLNPLQQAELIRKTDPDKPNNPGQTYLITENGKLFLSGKIIN